MLWNIQTGPVRFFVPYKRRKRDGVVDDELHGKLLQAKCEKRSALSDANCAKTEEATGRRICLPANHTRLDHLLATFQMHFYQPFATFICLLLLTENFLEKWHCTWFYTNVFFPVSAL